MLNDQPRILIVNPYGIGDCLFTTPLIRTLKEIYPKSYIGILLGSRTEEIFTHNPHINIFFTYNKDHLRSLPLWGKLQYLVRLLLKIKYQHFDIFIDLSNNDEYAFFAKFLWQIPKRIGFNYKNRGQFLNYKIKISKGFRDQHVSDYYNSLLKFLDIDISQIQRKLDFYIDPKTKDWANSLLKSYHLKSHDMIICILPGGGASWGNTATFRYWPATYYGQLANALIERFQAKIFIIGSSSEKKLAQEVIDSMKYPAINLCGQTSIHQLGRLMTLSHLIIGTESGPLHLATALDCPSLVIYGPVDETVYGPYSPATLQTIAFHTLSCRPCYKNFKMPPCNNRLCLSELTPFRLFSKACTILEQRLNQLHA